MKMTVQVKGLREAQRNLQRFPEVSKKHYGKAVLHGAQVLQNETQKMPPVNKERTGYAAKGIPVAPKYGGTLRQSLTTHQIQQLAAGVYPAANYGIFVHEGTRKMPARQFFQWALEFFGAQKKIDDVIQDATDQIVKELT